MRVVKKVVHAYVTLWANIRAGNLGGEKSRSRIAKNIVAVAERAGRGIALEALRGIRDRVRRAWVLVNAPLPAAA